VDLCTAYVATSAFSFSVRAEFSGIPQAVLGGACSRPAAATCSHSSRPSAGDHGDALTGVLPARVSSAARLRIRRCSYGRRSCRRTRNATIPTPHVRRSALPSPRRLAYQQQRAASVSGARAFSRFRPLQGPPSGQGRTACAPCAAG